MSDLRIGIFYKKSVSQILFFAMSGGCCAYCGKVLESVHRDHFVAAKNGGKLTARNIVPACPHCNISKSSKDPLDWLVAQPNGLVAYVRASQYLESR